MGSEAHNFNECNMLSGFPINQWIAPLACLPAIVNSPKQWIYFHVSMWKQKAWVILWERFIYGKRGDNLLIPCNVVIFSLNLSKPTFPVEFTHPSGRTTERNLPNMNNLHCFSSILFWMLSHQCSQDVFLTAEFALFGLFCWSWIEISIYAVHLTNSPNVCE